MNGKTLYRNVSALLVAFALASAAACPTAVAADTEKMMGVLKGMAQEQGVIGAASFDPQGNLTLPAGYRQWVFIGAPVTPNDMNGGKAAFPEFHHVYIDPASFQQYQKSGTFRDGTVLVKELASVGAKKGASGNGYFPGELGGLAVAVKSSARFPNEPGNWGYFDFSGEKGALKPTARAFPTETCTPCHKANAAQDMVFTQYYPVLRAARGK
jgi:hypothetical protein